MVVRCQRCGAEIQTFNKLRKWCVDCRKDLINERARMRTKARWILQNQINENPKIKEIYEISGE